MSGPLLLTVVKTHPLPGGLQRVCFSGVPKTRMEGDVSGLHIKLFFKKPEQAQLVMPELTEQGVKWPEKHLKPIARTYSVRDYDPQTEQLTVDFVLHEDPGVAADWAKQSQVGQQIGFAGPGPVRMIDATAQRAILVGDLCALPAIQSVVAALPESMEVAVWVELADGHEPLQEVADRPTLKWHWIKQDFQPEQTLLPAIKQMNWPIEGLSVALAGEHHSVACLRRYFRDLGIDKKQLYAVPYWRHQQDEETYHQARHDFMDEVSDG